MFLRPSLGGSARFIVLVAVAIAFSLLSIDRDLVFMVKVGAMRVADGEIPAAALTAREPRPQKPGGLGMGLSVCCSRSQVPLGV